MTETPEEVVPEEVPNLPNPAPPVEEEHNRRLGDVAEEVELEEAVQDDHNLLDPDEADETGEVVDDVHEMLSENIALDAEEATDGVPE